MFNLPPPPEIHTVSSVGVLPGVPPVSPPTAIYIYHY